MTASSTEKSLTSATCILQKPGSFTWETRKISQRCVGREVLVKVVATGICGSDVHYWKHGRIGEFLVENPIVLGHESAGVVESCGPDVRSVKVGDRVALEVGTSCLTCDQCRAGKYNLCGHMKFAATPPYDGTLAEFYRLPEECCWKLPDHVSFEQGALAEPLAVAVHSSKLGFVSPSTSVVIFGAGTVGLLCGAVAKAFGATDVIMVDITQSRLDFAREHLQIEIHNGKGHNGGGFDAQSLLAQLGCPDGADVVIDATGAEVCIANGLKSLRRGGCFVQVGLGPSDIKFPLGLVCSKEAVFKGSFRYGPGDYRLAIDLLAKRKVNVDGFVTDRYDFRDIEQAFTDTFNQKGIKNIIYGPGVIDDTLRSGTQNGSKE